MAQEQDVIDGPGKFKLAVGLFESEIDYLVSFKISSRTTLNQHTEEVLLTGALQTDASRIYWKFIGITRANNCVVEILYNINTRKGTIKFL